MQVVSAFERAFGQRRQLQLGRQFFGHHLVDPERRRQIPERVSGQKPQHEYRNGDDQKSLHVAPFEIAACQYA